jgi:hypothetical protein
MNKTRPLDPDRQDLKQPDEGRMLVWSRKGQIRLAVVGSSAVLAAAAVAGCGGDSEAAANRESNGGQGGQPQLPAEQRDRVQKFRDCMEENGVDLPDLSDGPPQGGPPPGIDPMSSEFRSAIQECGQLAPRPGGMHGPPGGPPGGKDGPPDGYQGGSSRGIAQ